jgi:hypothetical protein
VTWNSVLTDFLGMIRNWASTMGIFILTAIAQYLIDNQTWDWKQLLIAAIVAGAKYIITHYDHTKAKTAVKIAAQTGDVTAAAATTTTKEEGV